ncbi:protein CFAP20DC [Ciona intestinalis]
MFKNEFQGGPTVDVFCASGKDPLNKYKNPAVKRDYVKEVKGFVYVVEGTTTTARLKFPLAGQKQTSLGLTQRYLISQVWVPPSKDFGVELTMTDCGNNKRRFVMSSSVKDVSMTPLHAKLPLSMIKRETWMNLCLDLESIVSDIFPNQTFKSLEEFTLQGNYKLRRVFTMKQRPHENIDIADNNDYKFTPTESIPTAFQFASTLEYITMVISVPRIKSHLTLMRGDGRETSGYWSSSSEDVAASKRSMREQPTHIAFGTKVRFDPSNTKTRGPLSARRDRTSGSTSTDYSRQNSARKIRSSNARLTNQTKKKPEVEQPVQGTPQVLTQRETKKKIQTISKIPKPKYSDDHLKGLSSSFVNLVDAVDLSKIEFHSEEEEEDHGVFMFSSHPRSIPRIRTESGSTTSRDHEEDFVRSSSDSDEEQNLQRKIILNSPSPRNSARFIKSPVSSARLSAGSMRSPTSARSTVSPITKLSRDFTHRSLHSISQPQSSMSPDIPHPSSPPHHYSSAKYSDVPTDSRKPPIDRSKTSLRCSDATLTASVDTLVQNSMVEPYEPLDDSIEQNASNESPKLNLSQHFNASQESVVVSRKSIREIPLTDHERLPKLPESSNFQMSNWSDSFEAEMLREMKRENEEEGEKEEHEWTNQKSRVNFQDFDDSFDTSWSTYKNPPPLQPQAYDDEMKKNNPSFQNNTLNDLTLGQSNPRDWANLMSPPNILPSVRSKQRRETLSDGESIGTDPDIMGLSDGSSNSYRSSNTVDTDEEMLDLLYDPCLNCYFDPKSGKYYELKN